MDFEHITTDAHLAQWCARVAAEPRIALDTEFVSEYSYRPQLCLVQLAAGPNLAAVDSLAVRQLAPLWQLLLADERETIVHAGREELLFCLEATGRRPARLVDLQIAAGLVGYEYPAGYAALCSKVLAVRPHKAETRTDWRRRPLSESQLAYAVDDVRYLEPLRDALLTRLSEMGREAWLTTEMESWQAAVEASRGPERWWRVSGLSGLGARNLAIVREIWLWREREAERRDWPPRRVLRDDLVIELAKRRSADAKAIRAVRGMERGDLARALPQLSAAIARALTLPDGECPRFGARELPPQLTVLGQFLSTAVASICRRANVAPSLAGTASDVRDLAAYRLGLGSADPDRPPLLARGWRADVVGHAVEDLLSGRTSMRIRDPLADDPLVFESVADRPSGAG